MIASLLTFIPFERNKSNNSLDFSVLAPSNTTGTSNAIRTIDNKIIEETYLARDGHALHYRAINGTSKLTLILMHGSGSEGRYLLAPAKKLNALLGISVVIPDLRGHGKSHLSKRGDINYLGQFEDDLEDLNQHLANINPTDVKILAGHSSGGGLAIKYGGSAHNPFDGYLLLAPYLGYEAATIRPNSGGWVQVFTRRYIGLSMLNNVGITGLNYLPVLYFNRPALWNNDLQTEHYSYRLNESLSPQEHAINLQHNKKPILLLVGKNDEAFYADAFASIFKENAPHAEVTVLSNLKHLDLPSSDKAIKSISNWLSLTYKDALTKKAIDRYQ